MNVVDLGYRDYREVWELQKRVHRMRLDGKIDDTLFLVEHNAVITMGKSGKKENLLIPFELLAQKKIPYYHIERGGDITYHGPGQLVGYPIINIKNGLVGIKPFIEKIKEAIIATLAEFDIRGEKREKMVGVWTEKGKICSLGIAVKRWVSFHGFALNVNTDLENFALIVPCGLKNVTMTSMQEHLKREIPIGKVKGIIMRNFGVILNRRIKQVCLEEII